MTKITFVIVPKESDKPKVKKALDNLGVVSQFMYQRNINRIVDKMGPISNVLRQVVAKSQKDLFKMVTNVRDSTMVVGIDVVNHGKSSVMGLVASNSPDITQHFSQARFHDLYKDDELSKS